MLVFVGGGGGVAVALLLPLLPLLPVSEVLASAVDCGGSDEDDDVAAEVLVLDEVSTVVVLSAGVVEVSVALELVVSLTVSVADAVRVGEAEAEGVEFGVVELALEVLSVDVDWSSLFVFEDVSPSLSSLGSAVGVGDGAPPPPPPPPPPRETPTETPGRRDTPTDTPSEPELTRKFCELGIALDADREAEEERGSSLRTNRLAEKSLQATSHKGNSASGVGGFLDLARPKPSKSCVHYRVPSRVPLFFPAGRVRFISSRTNCA